MGRKGHNLKERNKKPTYILRNKQPKSNIESWSDMSSDNKRQHTLYPDGRKTKDQGSPVIDLRKNQKEIPIKNFQPLGNNQSNRYLQAMRRENPKVNLQIAISNLIKYVSTKLSKKPKVCQNTKKKKEWRKAKRKKSALKRGKKTVVNFSSRPLTDDEVCLLSKGLTFCP